MKQIIKEPFRIALIMCLITFGAKGNEVVQNTAEATANEHQTTEQANILQSIARFHASLLLAMQSNDSFADRYTRLQPVVQSLFDGPNIARICTGKTWRQLSKEDQQEFTQLMIKLIASTYTDRFDVYNDQVFKIDSATDIGKKRWLVKSNLTKADGEIVTLDYYLRSGRVFNVVANGVSDLSVRRADYARVLKREGYAALIGQIKQNIARMSSDAS